MSAGLVAINKIISGERSVGSIGRMRWLGDLTLCMADIQSGRKVLLSAIG